MQCDKENVPSYLHWNDREILEEHNFLNHQRFFRIKTKGNPVEFPNTLTAISCKWSHLIQKRHIVFTEEDRAIGDDYNFAFVKEIRNYSRDEIFNDEHRYKGTHRLTCVLVHKPELCNYAHCEILIRHRIYQGSLDGEPTYEECITHDGWNKAIIKKMKNDFFKQLRSDFKADMLKLISRRSWTDNKVFNKYHRLRFCLQEI